MENNEYIKSCIYKYLYELMDKEPKYFISIKDNIHSDDIIRFDSRQTKFYHVLSVVDCLDGNIILKIKQVDLENSSVTDVYGNVYLSNDLESITEEIKDYLDSCLKNG